MRVGPLQKIEWLLENFWNRNLIFFTMERRVLLVKQLPRSRKEKQVTQGKEGNESKLLPEACKMWMMDHLIHLKMMMKNQVQEVED